MRRLLQIATAALLLWAAIVYVSGGIEWRIGKAVLRSRDAARVLYPAALLVLVQALVYRREVAADLDRATAWGRRHAAWIGAAASLALFVHAAHHGAFVAGGADAYGYVSQAYGWATGQLPQPSPLPLTLPFPSGDLIQAPLGYRLGPAPHTMVPTYAPGLPLAMALGIRVAGAAGPYLVVPISAAVYAWSAFLLGRRAGGPLAGAVAAVLVATSPVVLFQSLFPMSDVPAGAAWTAAIVAALGRSRRAAAISGLCAALGLLIRPNLPLLVLVPLSTVVLTTAGRERFVRAAIVSLPIAAVVLTVAWLNAQWFGSPLASGYGTSADLYALSNIWPNLQRYPLWLWRSQSPLMLIALASFAIVRRRGEVAAAVIAAWAMFFATLASYVVYFPFQEWWYLRFLMPGLGAFFALAGAGLIVVARRVPRPWGHVAAAAIVLLLVKHSTSFAAAEGVFGPLAASEQRYADVGAYVRDALPSNAAVLAVQESGSIRHYGGRITLRWDLIDRKWTTRVPGELERLGLHPYLVIEDFERPQFREWFGIAPDAALPWPLVARMRENGGVSVLDLASQAVAVPPVSLEPTGRRAWRPPEPLR